MGNYTINHEVGIKASSSSVYEALTDTKKLAAWWISDARGVGSKVGGVLEFSSEYLRKFEVMRIGPPSRRKTGLNHDLLAGFKPE